jgi:hypothetical protein
MTASASSGDYILETLAKIKVLSMISDSIPKLPF